MSQNPMALYPHKFVGIKYTYRFRLRPNAEQRVLLAKHFGCTRYLYNYFLSQRQQQYLNNGKSNGYFKDCEDLTKLKKTLTWLTEVNSQSLQQTIKNLQAAYNNFFEGRTKFPKFKTKHDKQSFRVPQNIKLVDGKLFIPKFKEGIKCIIHREVKEGISYCTITKNKAGQYYCTLMVEKEIEHLPQTDKVVGIDIGIKTLVVDSNGVEYANVKPYRSMKRKIKKVQRKLSYSRYKTTDKKSKRIMKLRRQLARIHQKVKDVRMNHLHQTTRKLIDENQVICVETLAVKNMMKNHCLAGAIADCGWYELIRQLQYKAEWYGRTIVQIDRFYPSSKTCSACGRIKQDLWLSDREWTCPCGEHHDRDVNAAKMVLKQGLNQLRAERPKVKPTDSGTIRLNYQSAEDEVGSRSPLGER
jgi:putative transposase